MIFSFFMLWITTETHVGPDSYRDAAFTTSTAASGQQAQWPRKGQQESSHMTAQYLALTGTRILSSCGILFSLPYFLNLSDTSCYVITSLKSEISPFSKFFDE